MPRHRSHDLVDEAFQIDVTTLVRARVMDRRKQDPHPFGAVCNARGGQILKGECRAVLENGAVVALDIIAQIASAGGWGEFLWTRVCVDRSPSHRPAGGWRFRCPHVDVAGKECRRPTRTLYFAPRDCRLRCRVCAGLKYRSNVEEDKRLAQFSKDPERLELELAKAMAVLRTGKFPTTSQRLALKAAATLARDEGYVPFLSHPTDTPEFRRERDEINRHFADLPVGSVADLGDLGQLLQQKGVGPREGADSDFSNIPSLEEFRKLWTESGKEEISTAGHPEGLRRNRPEAGHTGGFREGLPP